MKLVSVLSIWYVQHCFLLIHLEDVAGIMVLV